MRIRLFAAMVSVCSGFAADIARAEPAIEQVAIPSLAVADDQLADPRKHFLLHKTGVSLEQAEADFSFCWRFLPIGVQRQLPDFVPWGEATAPKPVDYAIGQYGLVGAVIGSMIAGPLIRNNHNSRMLRCMSPRGYVRYQTSEAIWRQINSDDALQSIRLQARIAAGPVPPTPRVLK